MRRPRRRHPVVSDSPKREEADTWLALDAALKARLRSVLEAQRPLTEAEVRRLSDDGRACSLMLGAELRRGEERLRSLDADPASPLAEIATTFRGVSALRRDLDELQSLLSALDERARAARSAWLAASVRSVARVGPGRPS
jgi:hypothetical protein